MKKSVLLFLALMTFVPVLWAKLPDRLVFVGQGTNDSVKLSKIGNPKNIELFCIKNSGVPTPFVLDSSYGVGVNDTLTLLTRDKNRSFSKSTNDYYQFVITGKVAVSGSVMALVGIGGSIIPCDYCFYSLFRQCRGLTTLPKLPATILKDHCYERMFEGCSSLVTEADTLPAMTLCRSCYQSMFENCTSLVKAPVLPASQLAPSCYNAMFRGCASLAQTQDTLPAVVVDTTAYFEMFRLCGALRKAPYIAAIKADSNACAHMFLSCEGLNQVQDTLPTVQLEPDCFLSMYESCSQLQTAPVLIATRMANKCYYSMFKDCVALVNTQDTLPALSLAKESYADMYSGCKLLGTAPYIAATSLAEGSCLEMFNNCESLRGVQDTLPAMNLAKACYSSMFSQCGSITKAPVLPATQLAEACYSGMYILCQFSSVPHLPAQNLVDRCYTYMFAACPNLDTLSVAFSDWKEDLDCTEGWLAEVTTPGHFICPSDLPVHRGIDFIPESWTPFEVRVVVASASRPGMYDTIDTLIVSQRQLTMPQYDISRQGKYLEGWALAAGEDTLCGPLGTLDITSDTTVFAVMGDAVKLHIDSALVEVSLAKIYDGNTSISGCAYSGVFDNLLPNHDNVSVLVRAEYENPNVSPDSSKVINVRITPTGLDSMYYTLDTSFRITKGIITKLKLQTAEVSTADTFKVYDKTVAFATTVLFSLPNKPEQDRVLLNATAEFFSADAGDNKRVDVTYQFDATCAVCGNYDLPDSDVLYADIVPLRLTIAGTRIEDTKVYDATTDAWVEPGDLENVISGDIVNVDASAAYIDKNVGESKPVVVTYRISGSAAANYLAPIDDTLPADITPFQLLSEYFAVDQSKVYDQSDSAHVILGTVNSYLGDDIYAEAVATYLTNQVGNNIPVILVFSLSGADKDNYYAPINDTQYASITRRQLTAEGIVRVDTVRMYDGTNIAQITSHATMQGVLPGDQVFMFDSALYNDANPGINKTINVYYYIYGRDAGNYTAPIEFFYCNTAKILQSIVIDSTNSQQGIAFEVSSNGYCQSQTDGAIGYKISQGEACEFKLDFGASATGVGFQSIPWTALPNELQGEITLVIPDDCPAGQYDAIITFRNEIGVESTPTVVTFVVNLPKDYIVQIFNDVVSIDKHKIQGDSYQWYHNGERIPGATLPYYQQEGGLTGNYYVAVNLNTRSTVRTCDQSNWIKMVEQQKIVSVYPNPVVTAARVVLSNFEEEGHHISLTNAQGVRVYQSVFTGDETVLNFDLYNSGTYYLSVDGITAKVVKP